MEKSFDHFQCGVGLAKRRARVAPLLWLPGESDLPHYEYSTQRTRSNSRSPAKAFPAYPHLSQISETIFVRTRY